MDFQQVNPQSTGTYFVQDNYLDDSLETNPLLSYIAVDERATHNARVLLYNALKNENLEHDEILQLTEPENPDDPFITNYEKLQLYFMAKKIFRTVLEATPTTFTAFLFSTNLA